ncbi:MAG: MobF family relaxase [Chthoniobacter sp.]|uniref:MobF family relaxase n=1 Tax=Chthoniobacter sp. TaxID=2510640 RepID=UPI0032A5EEE3
MLSPKTQYNLKNAKEYFEEHLCVGDYYSEGKQVAGQWIGKGAEMLGLRGRVERDEFLRLCENLHPETGELLTQRRKTTRWTFDEKGADREAANRRVFYDFTISPPKDVSILALVGADERIAGAHDRAIRAAVVELEHFAATRVRSAGSFKDRRTGNFIGAVFRHETSRALDPHLHSHCILFNATHDATEQRWKALQNYQMLSAQKFVENVYYHELARELGRFGYVIANQARGDFIVQGVPDEVRAKFSKRHIEIDEKTNELLTKAPDKAAGNVAEIRENIAHNERARKMRDVDASTLRELWSGQLSEAEKQALTTGVSIARETPLVVGQASAAESLGWAEEHLFDRRSVVREHELWRHALEHARGCDLDVARLKDTTAARDYIRDRDEPEKVTTRETLGREWDVLNRARDGIGRCEPFNAAHRIGNEALDSDQRQAVEQILNSRDFMTLFRGGAGTGKSFALREVRDGLVEAGHHVCVIAPQRQQVIDLEADGFANAQTVSEFLTRREMAPGAVVILDEAGQLGGKQMQALLSHVQAMNGRLIASGDTRQHGAVEASDALRAIEKYSGLRPAELHEIRRQDPRRANTRSEREFIEEYRRAVKVAAAGDIQGAFDRLSANGALVECTLANQQAQLAEHYLDLAGKGQTTVVVAQTWSEIHRVNEVVRDRLKERNLIGADEHRVVSLERVDLTDAQKREGRFYDAATVLVFNQNCGAFRKGESAQLVAITDKGLIVESARKVGTVAPGQLKRLTICRKRDMALAAGDRLQLKANAQTRDGQRVANGELVTVERIEPDGRIALKDGRTLNSNYRQFVRGYAVTSYASQGKTVDYVLFSDSAVRAATNRQQWYVTISRGRKGIRIFTSDAEQLRENVARSGDRELALDLHRRGGAQRQRLRRRFLQGIVRGRQLAADAWRRFKAIVKRRTQPAEQREAVTL